MNVAIKVGVKEVKEAQSVQISACLVKILNSVPMNSLIVMINFTSAYDSIDVISPRQCFSLHL